MYHRSTENEAPSHPSAEPLLPPVQQPKGLEFVLKTWSGRLIALNTFIFIAEMLYRPGATFNEVPVQTLLAFGAKEPVLLAQGEYWRFFTPIFLHGNLLHILFNNWALYVVAFQLEVLLGARGFLLLYILAGIGGNLLSGLWGVSLSVGASGALFGLLGCAWFFERTISKKVESTTGNKPRAGAYTVMVVANILFGLMIPQIDNAAHIGGLMVGVTFAYVLLRSKPNRLVPLRKVRARIVMVLALLVGLSAAVVGASPAFVGWRLERAAEKADTVEERYRMLSRRLMLGDVPVSELWLHLRLALRLKDFGSANRDLGLLQQDPEFDKQWAALEAELRAENDPVIGEWLRRIGPQNPE